MGIKLIALHYASGTEKQFENCGDMLDYLRGIEDFWGYYYRYPNGYKTRVFNL